MNGGKFPPPKAAMKEVGGSYYTVKKIVPELHPPVAEERVTVHTRVFQFLRKLFLTSQLSSTRTVSYLEASAGEAAIRKEKLPTKVEETLSSATALKHGECEDGLLTNGFLLEKELTQNIKPSPELEEIPSNRQTVDGGIPQEAQSLTIDGVEGGDTNSKHEAEAKLQTSIAAEQTLLEEMSRISAIFDLCVACGKIIKFLMQDNKDAAAQVLESELESFSRSEEPENNIKQENSPVEDFKFDSLK
ncbi:uncharacterized protein LOC132633755 [Lycium barbarum]|uniref:uncharacterized protein LOC132633755 n=1 Tax=Lycium barbarum TaxID=112863 RepID=UPI00293E10E9|nr:uncharacterized protein LOC132633755 [Lycium barbarum]